jgi:putative oxidoreductase
MTTGNSVVTLVGRILIASLFIISGLSKIFHWGATSDLMAAHGMHLIPFFLTLATFIEIIGGVFVLFGILARPSALLLFLYLIPVTLIFHNFWAVTGMEHQLQIVNFLKNLCIMVDRTPSAGEISRQYHDRLKPHFL